MIAIVSAVLIALNSAIHVLKDGAEQQVIFVKDRTLHTDHQCIPHRFLSSMGINTFLKMQWMGMIRRIYGQNPNLTLI